MAPQALTLKDLYVHYHERLELEWVAGLKGGKRLLDPREKGDPRALVGHLNLIRSNRIQVLGQQELDYLTQLGKNSYEDTLRALFNEQTAAVIIAEQQTAPEAICAIAERQAIPLFRSPWPSNKLVSHLDYYLREHTAETRTIHGVFMDVMGIGVLLTGDSAIGKSELALELITRGHRLIADDSPEFARPSPHTLRGYCPEMLRDFLEVRGLGVLNIRAMFGDSAIKESKKLRLIIHLAPFGENLHQDERLLGNRDSRKILDVEITQIHIPVAPGRDLAVLVEAAVRNFILYDSGYDSGQDFINRQRRFLDQDP